MFSSWFPFNDNETPGYEIAFIIHIISGNVGGWCSAIANTHNYAMMVFAAGQLKILQNKLENLGNKKSLQGKYSINVINDIVNCVSHHNGIIR